jgi:hypothetical protein
LNITSLSLSFQLLAPLTHTQCHTFCLGPQSDQPLDLKSALVSTLILSLLNRQIDKTIFLKLGLGVEVCYQEARHLVLLSDCRHQLNVHLLCKVLHILLQIGDWCIDVHFVLPFVLCPFHLEFKFRAVSRYKRINKINLDLIDIYHMRQITA